VFEKRKIYGAKKDELSQHFQVEVFWVLMMCIFAVWYNRFGGTSCLHLHGAMKISDLASEHLIMLHNLELHGLFSLAVIVRSLKWRNLQWAGLVHRMGETRNAWRIVVGKPLGKSPLRGTGWFLCTEVV